MKKLLLLVAAVVMATGASAQLSLLKDVSKLAGSSKVEELQQALSMVQPALTNPETASNAQAWFLAGKAAFGIYDQLNTKKMLNQAVDADLMATSLMQGFEYLQKALPLDSVAETNKDGSLKLDKNGNKKIKTKYAQEIVGLLTGHFGDVAQLGNDGLTSENWKQAAAGFSNYVKLATSPFAKSQNIMLPDSTVAEIYFYEGYAHYNDKNFAAAFPAFNNSIKKGYTGNNVALFRQSALANVVQGFIDKQDYTGAINLVDGLLVDNPKDGFLYDMKGFALELKDDGVENALEYYKKACELDPNFANAFFDAGRALYLKADKIVTDNPDKNDAQLKPLLVPIYQEALPYLQKAVSFDASTFENGDKAQKVIDDIMYKLELLGVK